MKRLSLALFLLALCARADERPNILVILLDDMGWAQPGCYGGKLAPTPNIDRLAEQGARFTNGYVSAAVCSPSRAGLMSGIYQGRMAHDFLRTPDLDLKRPTMADRLHTLGYATGIVGKWHLGEDARHLPGARGFDSAYGSIANLGEKGFYRGTQPCERPAGFPTTTPVYAREAIDFIGRNSGQKPWFLYLAFNAVHVPINASEPWLARFAGIPDRTTRAYAAMIAEADDAIGRVLTALKDQGVADNTLIFCFSDNGGISAAAEMGGLRGHKFLLWEGGIRVPFIVSWPGRIKGGRTFDDPVIQLDIVPTSLAAAGAGSEAIAGLDGINLLPLLGQQPPVPAVRPLFWRYGPQFAVRQGDWKLVKAASDMTPMLVNLRADPGEQHDLTKQEPKHAAELLALWKDWNASLPPQRMDLADGRSDGHEKVRGKRALDND